MHAHSRLYQRRYAALTRDPQHGVQCGEVPVLHSMLLTALQQLLVLIRYAFCINGSVIIVQVYSKYSVLNWQEHLWPWQHRSLNCLTTNVPYSGRTAPLTSKRCILYICSTNTGTEYFKHGIHSPFLSLQNAVCFIILTCLVPVLFIIYIQSALKLKKNNSGSKRLNLG